MSKANLRIVGALALTLTGCGGGGGDTASPARPTVSLQAIPQSIESGDSTELAWSSTNAASCSASGGWSGPRPVSGRETVSNLTGTTSFSLSCTGAGGSAATSVRVDVTPRRPLLDFSVTPPLVRRGEALTITWRATNVTSCHGAWLGSTGPKPFEGLEQLVIPLSYPGLRGFVTMQCGGLGGSIGASVTFDVATLAVRVITPQGIFADVDVNDPNALYESNDERSMRFPIPTFGLVPGYVNMPRAGPPGRSFESGDVSDHWGLSSAQQGQVIRLILPTMDTSVPVADRDDADLYLYDSIGTLIDASAGTDAVETVVLPQNNNYIVEVRAVRGALTYLLSIEDPPGPVSLTAERLSASFVPHEAIVTFADEIRRSKEASDSALQKLASAGFQAARGSAERAQLLRMRLAAAQATQYGTLESAAAQAPELLQRKLETLLELKALRARGELRSADLNRIVQTDALLPTDPLYARQRWHYEGINLPDAWQLTTGSSNITVAVIDTGVISHPDLSAKFVDGFDFVSDPNGLDGNGIDLEFHDPGFYASGRWIFHGTHVAGTIGALANNEAGGVGIGWGVNLMPLRALDGRTGTMYDVLQAALYAARLPNDSGLLPPRPADIINLSLGAPGACLEAEIDTFQQLAQAGVIVVASAGNDSSTSAQSPASCPGVISVGASGASGDRASYSNFGPFITLLAPGGDTDQDIDGDGRGDGVMSTHATRAAAQVVPTFETFQGTSMAAPHVAGVLSLMKSRRSTLTPGEVMQFIESGALTTDVGVVGRDDDGYGIIDALKSVHAASGTVPVGPRVGFLPPALYFGNSVSDLTFTIRNAGSGILDVSDVRPTVPWASVAAVNVNSLGLGTYRATVSRTGIPRGTYTGFVEVLSNATLARLPIAMANLHYNVLPRPGMVYLRVLDAETGQTVRSYPLQQPLGELRLNDVPLGRFTFIAGTDMDNDGDICDIGELCGAVPVGLLPEPFDYRGVLDGLSLQLSVTALLTQASH